MDHSHFDALTRQIAPHSRRSLLGLLGTVVAGAFLARAPQQLAAKRKKKSCKRGKVACGRQCCPRGQGCVGGQCGCPATKCADAVDPTSDQFEQCSCELTVDNRQVCVGILPCGEASRCTTNGECPSGWVCNLDGCGLGDSVCVPTCALGGKK